MNEQDLINAKDELAKLPLLGPVVWLMGRDALRREAQLGELELRLMPPLVLDQLQIVTRFDVPWGFSTWAYVSDEVHLRLSSLEARIAPHEWRSGSIPWLIEVCAPFGGTEDVAQSALAAMKVQQPVNAWMPGADGIELRTLTAYV